MPEHFNVPWRELVASRSAAPAGDDAGRQRPLAWESFPAGTGAMIEALAAGDLDVAILLTEGAVAGQARGATYRIVSHYVISPLIWGVHVPSASSLGTLSGLDDARFAISRFGSGSHLMALALAEREGFELEAEQFVVVGSLDGAIAAFAAGAADVFMWEHFMTQPIVERGDFRRIADFVAPWAAFVTCAAPAVADGCADELRALIDEAGSYAARFAADPATPARLDSEFGIDVRQTREWLARTRWATGWSTPAADLAAAAAMLRRAGVIGA